MSCRSNKERSALPNGKLLRGWLGSDSKCLIRPDKLDLADPDTPACQLAIQYIERPIGGIRDNVDGAAKPGCKLFGISGLWVDRSDPAIAEVSSEELPNKAGRQLNDVRLIEGGAGDSAPVKDRPGILTGMSVGKERSLTHSTRSFSCGPSVVLTCFYEVDLLPAGSTNIAHRENASGGNSHFPWVTHAKGVDRIIDALVAAKRV